jgi:hypothetical protein
VTCGLNFLPAATVAKLATYSINPCWMSRPSAALTNAAAVPVFAVNGRNCVQHSLLEADQIFCGLDDNARDAVWWNGNVVVLERVQVPASRFFFGQNLVGRGVDLVKASCARELLNQCEMRLVSCAWRPPYIY